MKVYHSLTKKKEVFEPINPPFVGMYVCGPTVYSDVHLGNVRTFLSFDIIYRYLKHVGYKVRYVRNITDFHRAVAKFNILDPDIEPSAIGHIQEQIKMIEKLVEKGLAYEVNGSVYFDVTKYNEQEKYGILSGRVVEELQAGSRALDGQEEKRNSIYFALWKNASPSHR